MKATSFVLAAVALTASAALAQERVAAQAEAEYKLKAELAATAQLVRTRVPLETKVVKGAPYSAELLTEHTQVLADGNRIVRRTTGRVYRDGQGRTRREEDRAPGQVGLISINDPVGDVAYSLNPEARTATKQIGGTVFGPIIDWKIAAAKADPAEVERRKAVETEIAASAGTGSGSGSGTGVGVGRGGGGGGGRGMATATIAPGAARGWETKTEKLGARNVEGITAEGTRTTQTIPAGAIGNEQPILIVNEEWRSPELQVLVMTRSSDPRTGESVYKLTNITRAEPNPSWFEVPSDYTVKEYNAKIAPVRK